jgi:hypothetical protein
MLTWIYMVQIRILIWFMSNRQLRDNYWIMKKWNAISCSLLYVIDERTPRLGGLFFFPQHQKVRAVSQIALNLATSFIQTICIFSYMFFCDWFQNFLVVLNLPSSSLTGHFFVLLCKNLISKTMFFCFSPFWFY